MTRKLFVSIVAALAVAPSAFAGITPVPSLTPAATKALWRAEVAHARLTPRALFDASCRPARVVFYAQTDWLRLATKLAQQPSPCAEYYISIPPLTADKTQPRAGQAALIRALGPNFHAVDEINYTAWTKWVAAGSGSFSEAGVLARQRMAAAGFDTAAGDTWALNELSSAVRAGTGLARSNALNILGGLASDGVKGIAFGAGVSQALPDVSTYKVNVQNWLQDTTFWGAISGFVSDFAYENYGDVRDYAVAGTTPQQRRDAMMQYLGHLETLANAAPAGSATAAQAFLQQTHTTFGNAAWSWASAYGYTAVPLDNMEDFVAGQAYASRAFAAATGASVDRFGYAWAPQNVPVAESAALLDVLAVAIRDSGTPTPDVGVLACATLCATAVPGAAFTPVWQQFAAWTVSGLGFATAPQTITAGTVSGPVTIQVQTGGVPDTAKADVPVTLASSSPTGGFSLAATGPFTPTLAVTILAGTTSTTVYYTDTRAGTSSILATAAGQPAVAQTVTVAPAAAATLAVAPVKATVKPGARLQLVATAKDAFANVVPSTVTWTAAGGAVSATGLFTASRAPGKATVTATVGTLTATAAIAVVAPAPKITSARATHVAGRVVARVVVTPAKRVALIVRVRRGSSIVAVVSGVTTPKGRFTWRSHTKLPPGHYVVRATLRSASTA